MKKFASAVFCCLFFGICTFFSLGMLFSDSGEDEKRDALPQLFLTEESSEGEHSAKRINHSFGTEYEEWLSENFAFRDPIADLFASLKMNGFGEGNDQVIVGKDDFLFFNDTTADYIGTSVMTDEEIALIAEALLRLSRLAEENGARFLFVMAPNKNTVYGEMLPDRYVKSEEASNADRLYEALRRLDVPYLDLRSVLIEAAEDELVYHKRDTHWNGVGARLAFEKMAAEFGVALPDLSGRGPITDTKFEGDLDALLFPGKTMYDTDITYNFEGLFVFTTAYSTPMDLVISTRSGGNGKLLMFRDSFANAWIPYAASTFRETRMERVTPYRTDAIVSWKPDFVVVEIAERNLSTLADAVGIQG